MKDRVTELRMNRVTLASKYQQGSRLMVETESEIERLESMLIRALSGRIRERSAQAAEIESRLQTLSASEDELGSLERERMLAEQNYMSYAKRVEESRISAELDDRRVANIAILASPSLPIEPVSPNKVLVMHLVDSRRNSSGRRACVAARLLQRPGEGAEPTSAAFLTWGLSG